MSEQDNGCAAEELSEIERHIKGLETEVETLTKAGIIEVAVRNPSVSEYMEHWEGRAEKAEAEVTRLTTALENARKDAWQPIETAPKDGTEILLFGPGVLIKNGRSSIYAKARHIGWWVEPESSEDSYSFWETRDPEVSCRATHWQPLPEPPSLTPPTEKAT